MKSPLSNLLARLETRWLSMLYAQCSTYFCEVHLPSHNQQHHFRVWTFARELCQEWANAGKAFSLEELELLMIAVFFHDTGMSRSLDPRHGLHSRQLCAAFLDEHQLLPESDRHRLLDAVQSHDEKDYARQEGQNLNLLALLNQADDLDAFGVTGIYRYAEIYLLRGLSPAAIPEKVLENIDRRYAHLASLLPSESSPFANRCRERYSGTREFFRQAAEEGTEKSMAGNILQEVQKLIIDCKLQPTEIASSPLVRPESLNFWKQLEQEWTAYNYPPNA